MATNDAPWLDEPLREEFEHASHKCLLLRHGTLYTWCGYVAVNPGSPLYGVTYLDKLPKLAAALERRKQEPLGEHCSITVLFSALCGKIEPSLDAVVKVHGGITFSSRRNGEEGSLWWFGFDCSHCWDLNPRLLQLSARTATSEEVWRTVDYARDECKKLAEQIDAIEKEITNEPDTRTNRGTA